MDAELSRMTLVDRLIGQGHLEDPRVIEALRRVPRENFVPTPVAERAYEDAPVPIGHGQTISAPHMVAIMSQALRVERGQHVLEVGSGSGYQAAVLGVLVGGKGRVDTVERIPQLARRASNAVAHLGLEQVRVHVGDGSLGHADAAPYDRILVTAAAPSIPPPLLEQLARDGLLLVPIGTQVCELVRVRRSLEGTEEERLGACSFVPLRGVHGQPRDVES